MLLLYKYALILVIILNINEIRSRTLSDLDAAELTASNGTSIASPFTASTTKSQQVGEKRGRDSEEENDDDDDDDDEEVEDDESAADDEDESDEPSEKAAVLDEEYMKNPDVVDNHMTELYNEVVGGKKKSKDSSSKDGGTKYTEEKPEGEQDKVEYEKEKDKDHHGEKSPSKKKKGELKEKILPLLIIPYAIQMVIIPLVVFKLKMLALKAMAIGKLAIIILLFNYFKYSHNAKASHVDEQYISDNQLLSEHYGYSGAPEVGGWVNGRSMEQFNRRRRR